MKTEVDFLGGAIATTGTTTPEFRHAAYRAVSIDQRQRDFVELSGEGTRSGKVIGRNGIPTRPGKMAAAFAK